MVAALLLAACIMPAASEQTATQPASPPADAVPAQVLRVMDGGAIVVTRDDTELEVAYAGINAPAFGEPFYNEAAKLNQLLIGGQEVFLLAEGDVDASYYVFTRDGLLVNAEMARQGMVRVVARETPSELYKRLIAAEAEARSQGLGVWN